SRRGVRPNIPKPADTARSRGGAAPNRSCPRQNVGTFRHILCTTIRREHVMIPQEKIAAATRGLSEAFGVLAFDDIRDLTERPGSNRAFRIVVRGSAYLLRINTRAGDTTRHFGCMQAAAEAGLAPRVRYASAEDRVSISDFVEAVPSPAAD